MEKYLPIAASVLLQLQLVAKTSQRNYRYRFKQ